jgi:hypothetical protein
VGANSEDQLNNLLAFIAPKYQREHHGKNAVFIGINIRISPERYSPESAKVYQKIEAKIE